MLKVFVAEDEALVRGGLCALLELEPDMELAGEASDGAAAVEGVLRTHPDVVLMDVQMPVLDGIEATRRILAAGSRARIVMVTTFDQDEYVYRALRAGASGFLLKALAPERLAAAVRTIASGESVLDPVLTRRLIEEYLVRPAPDEQLGQRFSDLTEREREVWRLLAQGKSNAEMGNELFLSDATVKSHVTRLLSKLGVRSRVGAVVLAYESGLVRPGGRAAG
ncbi:response regulator transcription factor [Solirubrobacter sp. CPCC 204708]|uniref:Response regulator transcription factor n=1 Tax=Solirubrobacter deserti TaxID=2282478 RepID=A0ABT4RDP0_9ACTN|nr:response regulator transcription factor [Solirubrobacter deserti]MBE2314626.1 response regulator transcription factor [Solirubrobacter deserti]MDA0136633.1 response regulator transcription factor [Solirubrobacter deserti]